MKMTNHGEGRVRKRIGISKRNVTLTSTLAWNEGLDQTHFRGSFLRYLNAIYRKSPSGTKLKVYNGYLYILRDGFLITVWVIPPKFRNSKAMKDAQSKGTTPASGYPTKGSEGLPEIPSPTGEEQK